MGSQDDAKAPPPPAAYHVKQEIEAGGEAVSTPNTEEKNLWAKGHYCWQVALINQVVAQPWHTCFGSLGTGFVGVAQGAIRGDDLGPNQVPLDATIIIFVSAPAAQLQQRGGRTMDGYKDALDTHTRTLEWSGQRNDRQNRRTEAIMNHRRNGGRVVVAVRSPTKREFEILGEVSKVDLVQKAKFLVEHGDHVIQERGTRTFHRYVTAACLNIGLRSGVGLTAARYPIKGSVRWCSACCYAPPKGLLHFRELRPDGVAAFQQNRASEDKLSKREKREEAKHEKQEVDNTPVPRPLKRLCVKTNPDAMDVKNERSDEDAGASVSVPFAVKKELEEDEDSSF